MISTADLLNGLFDKEIAEVKGTISNESLWEAGYNGDPPNPHTGNIAFLYRYLGLLKSLRNGVISPETIVETATALDDDLGICLLNALFDSAISETQEKISQLTAGDCGVSYISQEQVSVFSEYIETLRRMSRSLNAGADAEKAGNT